ncbi:MAG: metallophosphoesterase [Thermoleophilaceae bacterium]|nr:metallophosphoesterase [Thermoleophilaceae bacterium]
MLIRAYSDLHGMLPRVDPCDVLLLGGDVSPLEGERDIELMSAWVEGEFTDWLTACPADRILLVPGNHDFVLEARRDWPELPAELLIDQSVDLDGLSLYASPWVPTLKEWAFYGDDEMLRSSAAAIPEGTDIWLEHGPPYGYLDRLWRDGRHVGNPHTRDAMVTNPPQFFLCGHIHEGAGITEHHGVTIANNSFVDEFYEPQFRHLALRAQGRKLRRSPEDETNASQLWTG